ncbi:hypothetical protein AgCh_033964 [Apium graveolens]
MTAAKISSFITQRSISTASVLSREIKPLNLSFRLTPKVTRLGTLMLPESTDLQFSHDGVVGEALMEESVIIAEPLVIWLEISKEEDDDVAAAEEMVVLSAADLVTLPYIVGMDVAKPEVESVIVVVSLVWPGIVRMENVDVAAEGIVSAVEREDTSPKIAPIMLMSNFIVVLILVGF